ncbi:IS3 family transposase [Avibacterium paragallinarum]|uniref:IS3 family transposase n=1 Tax=Avibacterium paragallinarum TaxID=728 RepID=UPI001CFB3D7F
MKKCGDSKFWHCKVEMFSLKFAYVAELDVALHEAIRYYNEQQINPKLKHLSL